jgi:hypothetical protein
MAAAMRTTPPEAELSKKERRKEAGRRGAVWTGGAMAGSPAGLGGMSGRRGLGYTTFI